MSDRRAVTDFYVETLMMILVFIGIMMVLTRIFVLSKAQENKARNLTRAVTIAANVAEGLSLSDDIEKEMNEIGLTGSLTEDTQEKKIYEGDWKWTGRDRKNQAQDYRVRITCTLDAGMAHYLIEVFHGSDKKPVYELKTEKAITGRRGAAA